jgi:Response regulators consisting of a CheY-like receiver domain and a winged-helix DNA-binding domain
MRVLIVEDEAKMAGLIQRGLRQEAIAAGIAPKGEDALWMAGSTEYDAIVLDLGLPGSTASRSVAGVRAGSKVPIVMLTARDEEPDRVAGLERRGRRLRLEAVLAAGAVRTHKGDSPSRRAPDRGRGARCTRGRPAARLARSDRRGHASRADEQGVRPLACFLEHPGIVLSRERLLDLSGA